MVPIGDDITETKPACSGFVFVWEEKSGKQINSLAIGYKLSYDYCKIRLHNGLRYGYGKEKLQI